MSNIGEQGKWLTEAWLNSTQIFTSAPIQMGLPDDWNQRKHGTQMALDDAFWFCLFCDAHRGTRRS
eukprot:scaffold79195_cov19-Prasinocladus_malaysianus.AAC.1